MNLCPKCQKRVAKRSCRALGTDICQLCCGRLREKELHCPPACTFLGEHKHYHEKRILDRKPSQMSARPDKDVLNNDRMAWLAVNIEIALRDYAVSHPEFRDKDAAVALEYAREKIDKGAGRLILPGAPLKPVNEAGEFVARGVEASQYQRSGILLTDGEAYKKNEKLTALDRVASGLRLVARTDPAGQAYVRDIVARYARAGDRPQGKKLITLA